jgi:hypothetical protein
MFLIYFAWSAIAIPGVLYVAMSAQLRLSLLFLVGFSVFGVFASFTFYLPELFPTRLVCNCLRTHARTHVQAHACCLSRL